MKVSEIVVGGKYEGKNGGSRDVVAEGPHLAGYSARDDLDYIQWGSKNARFGNCTRKAFAAWARKRVGSINLEETPDAPEPTGAELVGKVCEFSPDGKEWAAIGRCAKYCRLDEHGPFCFFCDQSGPRHGYWSFARLYRGRP